MEFSKEQIQQVWEKGVVVTSGDQRKLWRRDPCGAWMYRFALGEESEFGWVVGHFRPTLAVGRDTLPNLRPVQWENAAQKADGSLQCAIKAEGERNVGLDEANRLAAARPPTPPPPPRQLLPT